MYGIEVLRGEMKPTMVQLVQPIMCADKYWQTIRLAFLVRDIGSQ